uniref:(northern house mosquito) hypothetical protein n=1 Tax=Culex pipiens TaxID=7175 RepID=A0A8D8CPS8_CULPI
MSSQHGERVQSAATTPKECRVAAEAKLPTSVTSQDQRKSLPSGSAVATTALREARHFPASGDPVRVTTEEASTTSGPTQALYSQPSSHPEKPRRHLVHPDRHQFRQQLAHPNGRNRFAPLSSQSQLLQGN